MFKMQVLMVSSATVHYRVKVINYLCFSYAPVAQRIRVSGFEPEGRRFKSCRGYQNSIACITQNLSYMELKHHPDSHKRALLTIESPQEAHVLSMAMTNRLNKVSRYIIFNLIHYSSFRILQSMQVQDKDTADLGLSHLQLRDISRNINPFGVQTDSRELHKTKADIKSQIDSYLSA
jgi:hypothetical protein